MKNNEGSQEKNYRKLWIAKEWNAPFSYAVSLVQKKWQKSYKGRFLEVKKAQALIKQLDKAKEFLDSQDRVDDVVNLAKEFEFEDFWIPYLTAYIITGKIFAPPNKPIKKTPPTSVLQKHKMFLWRMKEWNQKRKLKAEGFKTRRRDEHESYGRGKYMTELPEGEKVLSEKLIYSDENIADIVFGKGKGSRKATEKRTNMVVQEVRRFKRFIIPLTFQHKRRLDKIFS